MRAETSRTLSDSARASGRERAAFAAVAALLSALAWLPVWSSVFPPLQDYPNHLAQVGVLRAGDAPDSPYAEHFTTDPGLRPYATFYTATLALASVLPLELAGRVALSVPGALWLGLLLGGVRRRGGGEPWGALVWLPLSAGLAWHLGLVAYLWSLPLLGLALEDQGRLARGEGGRACALRLALWIAGLFLSHPFTFLAYLGLGALRLGCERAETPSGSRGWLAWGAAAGLFVAWLAIAAGGRGVDGPGGVDWLPFAKSAELLTLPFTGMRGFGDPDGASLAAWAVVGAAIASAAWRRRGVPRFAGIALALCAALGLAAPFRVGPFTFLNARVAEIAFLCLGLAAGGLRLPALGRVAVGVGVAAALALSTQQQRRVALELAELAPLLERIPPQAALLPLVFDASSPELSPSVCAPHLHVHHYFHVRRGGGVSPYFFRHPLGAVRYREGSPPTAPPQQRPSAYHPVHHGAWDHLLVRAAPPLFARRLAGVAELVAEEGAWRLYAREPNALGAPRAGTGASPPPAARSR